MVPLPLEDLKQGPNELMSSPKLDEGTSNDDQTHLDEGSENHGSHNQALVEPSQTSSPIRVKDEAVELEQPGNSKKPPPFAVQGGVRYSVR